MKKEILLVLGLIFGIAVNSLSAHAEVRGFPQYDTPDKICENIQKLSSYGSEGADYNNACFNIVHANNVKNYFDANALSVCRDIRLGISSVTSAQSVLNCMGNIRNRKYDQTVRSSCINIRDNSQVWTNPQDIMNCIIRHEIR